MHFIRAHQAEILIILAIIIVVQVFIVMGLNARLNRVSKLLRSLFSGPEGEDLEALLRRCLNESERALQFNDETSQKLLALTEEVRDCVQHLGLVRYDAYGDVSGQQSFSLALLDGHLNGAIVTALFGRQDSRCYGKAVTAGQTDQTLSEEEDAALKLALQDGSGGSRAPSAALSANTRRRILRKPDE